MVSCIPSGQEGGGAGAVVLPAIPANAAASMGPSACATNTCRWAAHAVSSAAPVTGGSSDDSPARSWPATAVAATNASLSARKSGRCRGRLGLTQSRRDEDFDEGLHVCPWGLRLRAQRVRSVQARHAGRRRAGQPVELSSQVRIGEDSGSKLGGKEELRDAC